MNELEGNPFLNWKKIQVTYKGILYELHAKVFACNIGSGGVGYHLKFKDSHVSIAFVGSQWIRLDQKNNFAEVFGGVINKGVQNAWTQFHNDKVRAEKEAKKSGNGNWGISLKNEI